MVRFSVGVLLPALFVFLFNGCSEGQEGPARWEPLDFAVTDSLLGPVYPIPRADCRFRPPIRFAPVADSVLTQIRSTLQTHIPRSRSMRALQQAFVHPSHHAAVLVSTIEELRLGDETTEILTAYDDSLRMQYGSTNVLSGTYMINNVHAINYLMTDSLYIRFQLICLSADKPAAELQYVTPRDAYESLLRSLESSIGSLNRVSEGR